MYYGSLIAYYLIYFISNGLSSFLSKYYAEIGMSESKIGVLMSVPMVLALLFMPLMGALSDRISKKRYLLAAELVLMAICCFLFPYCKGFVWMFLAVMGYNIFYVSVAPLATTISLEYCTKVGKSFGLIRLSGTIGYQLGVLGVGALLSESLQSLYPMMAASMVAACLMTFLMPNVEGHQHNKRRVPLSKLFADKHLCWFYGIIFLASIGTQFYTAFFSKHFGDLGMNNHQISLLTFLATAPELPFLLFGDKLAKKINVWNILIIGVALSCIRWIGMACLKSFVPIAIVQILNASCLVCFEFVPAFYLNRRVAPEIIGTAQTVLNLASFGFAKIIGGLLGGIVSEQVGIPAVFALNAVLALLCLIVFYKPTRRLIEEERIEDTKEAHT